MNAPKTVLPDFITRTLLRPGDGDWLVLVVPRARQPRVIQELADALGDLSEAAPIVARAGSSARSLVSDLARARASTCIISGVERFDLNEWGALDGMRSMLARSAPVIVVIDERAVEVMAAGAPNLFSWAGGSVFELQLPEDEPLGSAERERRLQAFRDELGLSDEEVIRRGEEGTLSSEPEFAEWLSLLGRNDLLEG